MWFPIYFISTRATLPNKKRNVCNILSNAIITPTQHQYIRVHRTKAPLCSVSERLLRSPSSSSQKERKKRTKIKTGGAVLTGYPYKIRTLLNWIKTPALTHITSPLMYDILKVPFMYAHIKYCVYIYLCTYIYMCRWWSAKKPSTLWYSHYTILYNGSSFTSSVLERPSHSLAEQKRSEFERGFT